MGGEPMGWLREWPRLAAAILCFGVWALPVGAQEFAIPPQAELDAMSPAQKAAMERELTAAAADWPMSAAYNRVRNPEMSVWNPRISGTFRGTDDLHWAEGQALVSVDEFAGEIVVRLEDFTVPNGPGLHVYLVAAEAPATPEDVAEGFIDLGPLKANRGDHNYVREGNLGDYRSVVVYSQPFDVIFAVASLTRY